MRHTLYWKKVFRHLRFHSKWGRRRPQRADSSANFLSEFPHFWLPAASFRCNSIISYFPSLFSCFWPFIPIQMPSLSHSPLSHNCPDTHKLLSLLTAALWRQAASLLQNSFSAVAVLSLQWPHGSLNPKTSCLTSSSLFHLPAYLPTIFFSSSSYFPITSNFQHYFSTVAALRLYY